MPASEGVLCGMNREAPGVGAELVNLGESSQRCSGAQHWGKEVLVNVSLYSFYLPQ